MEKDTQVQLIDELLELHDNNSPFLDEHWERPTLERYLSPQVFERERDGIFRRLPHIVAHVSELPGPGDFITTQSAGRPLLLARGHDGIVRAFYNVCRHRGAQLVKDEAGCTHRFSCPYHAWTWNNAGELIGVPHEKTGFPDLDRAEFGLHRVACQEYAGWIWVSLAQGADIDVAAHLGDIGPDMLAMNAADHVIAHSSTRKLAANWKILVEGGIESYHFRVAHRDTISSLFLDNLSSYQCFGPHMRSVLPRSSLPELREKPADEWHLGEHANVLYSLFPGAQFLMQEDHFVWIQGMPVDAGHTRLRLVTLVPKTENTAEKQSYWRRHHEFTGITLDEDFHLAESIQHGLDSGANTHLNFGRFEGALVKFNAFVDAAIA